MRTQGLLAAGLTALAAVFVGLIGAAGAGALPAECSQSGFTVTCTYTSGANPFTVPKGVSTLHVVAVGGSGGAGAGIDSQGGPRSGGVGGAGARVDGDLTVTPGSLLYVVVGGNGAPGSAGGGGGANGGANGTAAAKDASLDGGNFSGGGGGASDVRTSGPDPTSALVVAAGGGGGGSAGNFGDGGAGGAAGAAGSAGATGTGPGAIVQDGGGGGEAGSASAGGAGGAGSPAGTGSDDLAGCTGWDGSAGYGGLGSSDSGCRAGGGGGGGGRYGGGGGGASGTNDFVAGGSGGGGGGSSLVPAGGSLALDATGVPEVVVSYPAPDVVTPASLDFGSAAIGAASAAKTVTLSDTGSVPIGVSSVTLGGTNPGDFTVTSDGCSGKSVASGGSCSVQVAFAPAATGARTATLNLVDDATDSPQSVSLAGSGTLLADVKIGLTGPSSAAPGSQNTYVFTVSNAGPSTASGAALTAQVPNGTKFVGVTMTEGSCTHPAAGSTSGTITCSLGDLAAGASALNNVTLKITLTSKGGTIAVAGKASSSTSDPNLGNNVASLTTTVRKK